MEDGRSGSASLFRTVRVHAMIHDQCKPRPRVYRLDEDIDIKYYDVEDENLHPRHRDKSPTDSMSQRQWRQHSSPLLHHHARALLYVPFGSGRSNTTPNIDFLDTRYPANTLPGSSAVTLLRSRINVNCSSTGLLNPIPGSTRTSHRRTPPGPRTITSTLRSSSTWIAEINHPGYAL